ncbi:MAG: lysophospholipid acyltransferase family protein [Desulfobacteraceae bacterium]|nr:lysophospholipid acyltransferase family protein [Desulfobacteraceae bacterium]
MLRAYLYLSVFIPITALFALSASICSLFDSSGRSYAFHARLWARFGLALNNTPVTVRGVEHLPDGPFILMSNHQSNFDILALIATIPRRTYWIAKKELFDIPVFGPSMRRGGYIPLDRSDGRKALKSMENAADIIRKGSSVVMFPEGTRSRDGHLLPFKRGGFMLAVRAGVPVVPVTINGSGRVNPGGQVKLYSGNISLSLHPQIDIPDGMKKNEVEEWLMERVQGAINSGLEV